MIENRFRLDSGERQIGQTLDNIRKDHIYRYTCVVKHLQKFFINSYHITGLDIFTATGYGANMIVSEIQCKIDAFDASQEAIDFAKENFKHKCINYNTQLFPFPLDKHTYDFIVCIESLEHVHEYKTMIATMHNALKPGGLFFLSVPNETILTLVKSKNKYHVKHFTKKELINIYCEELKYICHAYYGQDAYILNDGFIVGGILEEKMNLIKNYEGQWHMFVFEKAEQI